MRGMKKTNNLSEGGYACPNPSAQDERTTHGNFNGLVQRYKPLQRLKQIRVQLELAQLRQETTSSWILTSSLIAKALPFSVNSGRLELQ